LRAREAPEAARTNGDEPRAPAVELRHRRRDRRGEGRDRRGQERETEHLDDDRDGHDVRGNGDERDLVELKPRHRGRGKTARGGDADELRDLVRDGVSVQEADDARRDHEDRRDGGEGELEAGIEQRVRVPGEEQSGSEEQRLPAVALARGQPGERGETGGECRSHHGRMEPNRKRVGGDGEQRRDLREIAPEPREQDDGSDTAADRGDLQPVDGEAVVEAGGTKVREQPLVETRRAAEDDRLDHVPPVSRQVSYAVAREPAADTVAQSGDAAAPAHRSP
jgi:hypothetical protein